jgi:hypothetical protein
MTGIQTCAVWYDSIVNMKADSLLTGLASSGVSVALVGQAPPELDISVLMPYVVAVVGPVLVLIANRVLAMKGNKKRARAAALREDAKSLLDDGDSETDVQARKLLRAADELEAEADGLEGLSAKK